MSTQRFDQLAEKVTNGQRLSFEDGVFLFEYADLLAIGQLANMKREQLHDE